MKLLNNGYLRSLLISTSLILTSIWADAQTFDNTIELAPGQSSPQASINDIGWIQGYWSSNTMGGQAEEFWSQPLAGSMSSMFRLIVDGKVSFYEIQTIYEEDSTLKYKLKHFTSDLKGWEEKDQTVEFPLVKLTEDKVYFSGLTFERVSSKYLNIYVRIGKEGQKKEVKFEFTRLAK